MYYKCRSHRVEQSIVLGYSVKLHLSERFKTFPGRYGTMLNNGGNIIYSYIYYF